VTAESSPASAFHIVGGMEFGQWSFLTRHFFRRMFRNDFVDFEDQMKERLIAVLSVLAIVLLWSSHLALFKYVIVPDTNLSWQEKSYVFTLMMIIFGLVTLLEWDVLFPDRQDFLNLIPLPVRLRTVFLAKLGSFFLFIGLFSVAMNSGAAVLFAIYLAPWRSDRNLLFFGWHILSHLISAFAACFFVFFACVFLHFILMAVLPDRVYRRISLAVRVVLVGGFIFLLLAFLLEPKILDKSFLSLAKFKEAGDPLLVRFPPFWFVGLYERLLGTTDPVFAAQTRAAVLALLLSLGGFAAASGLSYYRHVRKTLESEKKRRGVLPGLREAWSGFLGRTVLRSHEERAVYGFFTRTVRSGPKQRIALAYYTAVGAGVLALYIVSARGAFRDLSPTNAGLLVQPLFLSFVIVAGFRSLVNIPAWPAANWIFEVTETGRTRLYSSGLKKAVFLRWLLPFSGLVFGFHLFIWKFWPALEHAVFVLVVSSLGLEAFFFRFRKVPFACSTVPGKTKFHTRLIPIVGGSFVFFSLMSVIERALLRTPGILPVFLAAAAGCWLAIRLANVRFYREASLVFEEQPEPALLTLPEEI
jgi:hypothetical protein